MTLRGRGLRDQVVGIDLGTARTKICLSGAGIVLDEPTLAAYDGSGAVIAAGHDAWVASETGPARLQVPVRGGVIGDPVGCVHTIRLLLRKARVTTTDGRDIAVSLPATANARDASVLTAVMASATGGRITAVQSTLAASIGSGIGVEEAWPHAVLDLGAGVTELAVIADGQVLAVSALRMGIRDYDDDSEPAEGRIVELLRRVLNDIPERVAGDVAAGDLLLVGGGASQPELAARLSRALGMPVRVPPHPREVVVDGLGRCLAGPMARAVVPRGRAVRTRLSTRAGAS